MVQPRTSWNGMVGPMTATEATDPLAARVAELEAALEDWERMVQNAPTIAIRNRGAAAILRRLAAARALLTPADGSRVESLAALEEAARMLGYLWTAENYNGSKVCEMFYDDDPLTVDVPRILAALAPTPPEPAATVERCAVGVSAVHAGIPTVVVCGETRDSETHETGAPDYDHPFAATVGGVVIRCGNQLGWYPCCEHEVDAMSSHCWACTPVPEPK
jgi:hypothetical protein